jgi:signal transduction histidine kinase
MPIKKQQITAPRATSQTPRTNRSNTSMSMEETLVALIKRNEELVSLSKSKDEFIAITSHQLRTPATAVKQYLALLLEGYADPLTKDQKIFLEKAYENNERQLHIVDNILRVAQLDLNNIKLELHVTDLKKLLQETLESLAGLIDGRQQKIQLTMPEGPVRAKVDAANIKMAIENLIENASNYSLENSKIAIKLSQQKNGHIKIAIQDEGIGIKSSDFPKLFQKFSRLNNPASETVTGTGLGLYFCKKIIELHGGKIDVMSSIGRGSIFTITL